MADESDDLSDRCGSCVFRLESLYHRAAGGRDQGYCSVTADTYDRGVWRAYVPVLSEQSPLYLYGG